MNIQLAVFNDRHEKHILDYSVKKINTRDSGINGFILIPNYQKMPKNMSPEIKIIFTGTKDKAGIFRDLEPHSPGYYSYYKNKHIIQKALEHTFLQLQSCYPNLCKPIKISTIGHSLGAADAQRTALLIARLKADNKNFLAGKKLFLNLVSNCSPKVTKNEANAFTKALYFAKHQGLVFGSQICKYNLDFVPKFGECDIRAGFYTPKGKKTVDTFDLAPKGIKLLYGKTHTPFLHESPVYNNKKNSKLYRIDKKVYYPSKRGIQPQKPLIKKILNSTTSIDKSAFAHLIKVVTTKIRYRLENEQPYQEEPTNCHNFHTL